MASNREHLRKSKNGSARKEVNETNPRKGSNGRKVRAVSDAPDVIVRVNVGYALTMVKIALEDKAIFDALQLLVGKAANKRISHHELFALIVAMANENRAELVARAKRAKSTAAWARATRAAVTAVENVIDADAADEA